MQNAQRHFSLDCQQLNPRMELCVRMAPDSPTMAPEAFSMPDALWRGGLGTRRVLKRLSGSDRVQTVRGDLGPI